MFRPRKLDPTLDCTGLKVVAVSDSDRWLRFILLKIQKETEKERKHYFA